ncbi:MAG TPA: ribosomal protein S18-alanine N-acetyltransferase [Terriglobia bacterium]|nr:ribosomal protein S18-alanine N-acetyltransferase [Terriglobia bacterium]
MRKSGAVSSPEKSRKRTEPSLLDAAAKAQVRLFGPDDLEGILEIQNASRAISAWRVCDYERLAADPQGLILVAESEARMLPEIVGFSVFYRMDKESELWNIAVQPAHRRQSIARALLVEACKRLAESGVQRLFLEVRESNLPAAELYYSFGFELLGRRKEYYVNPKEDALVLVHKLIRPGIRKA